MKRAIIIGATGLVGRKLVELLLTSNDYKQVTLIVRKFQQQYAGISKVQQIVLANFLMLKPEDVEGYSHAFSCLGTTLKQAKSKQCFYETDYGINMHFAQLLQQSSAHYLLISAAGASVQSPFFYTRVKGELERDVQALNLAKISFLRPSLLIGEHADTRLFEKLAQSAFLLTEKYLPKRYKHKPVTAMQVAQTLVAAAATQVEACKIYDNLEIQYFSSNIL
ncbi:nucleoside-diphosphate sugar epimerase [Acinetobacter sp. MD2]|uniref:nucleoside-diphosphate sugar epimerase n=1 Tax=Acinetobacter sp. MD2 TaxID=2600066 RepID=UPI002D1F2109|nr:nucleoside-diphosphate sugar epimerase [Acinetobacter sp. MD2]MEB3766556.1 nucleoside-diphosphate sugar epimerase [Acinetobacter sp. MD2]